MSALAPASISWSRGSRSSSTAAMTRPGSRSSTMAGSTACAPSATSPTCAPRSPSSAESGGVAVATSDATTGVAHTRWATHGRVTEENAHPHGDCTDRIHIVLNGIVENHAELRRELGEQGHHFSSETDAEIVAHLIERNYDGDLAAAVRDRLRRTARPLRLRRHARRGARAPGRRPQGVPAGRRRRRGGGLPRLGDPRLPRRDPRGGGDRKRRDRQHRCLRGDDHRRRGQPGRA